MLTSVSFCSFITTKWVKIRKDRNQDILFNFCINKQILGKDFWCVQHSQKPSSHQNRTLLCPLCASVWRTQTLMLSCYWLVLLPCNWQFPLPSGTLSICPQKGNQDARKSSCFTHMTGTLSSNNSYVIISQQALWKTRALQHPIEIRGALCLDNTQHTSGKYMYEKHR